VSRVTRCRNRVTRCFQALRSRKTRHRRWSIGRMGG
jgi:hypothetical protein